MKVYLASTSPRRILLLKQAGMVVRTIRPRYVEVDRKHLSTRRLIREHALGKALSVVHRIKDGIVISADTLVVFRGRRIGKPKDMKDAYRILTALQGRTHTVWTGVAVMRIRAGRVRTKVYFAEKTKVTLKPVDKKEMAAYFKRIRPLDKAGAYAIQSRQQSIVSGISGSYTNAVGLPMEKLKKVLVVLE